MNTTRITVRNVDQDVIDRVRLHIRTYGLSLGGVVTAALANHMELLEHYSLWEQNPGSVRAPDLPGLPV
jgi:hypothetical protein